MLPRRGQNAAFDQVGRAVTGILKKLAVGLFDKLLLYTCHKHGPLNHVGG
jgi:hypothetical protein